MATDFMNEDQLAEIASANGGEVIPVNTVKGTAVFRYPKRTEFSRFQGTLLGDNSDAKANAAYVLCVSIVVSPERKVFQEWCESRPGIPMACIGLISKAAGTEGTAHEKKSED